MAEDAVVQVQQFLKEYLDTYFIRRNLRATLDFFRPDISVVGTGAGENARGLPGTQRLYDRDINEAPNPVYYQIEGDPEIRVFTDTAMLTCVLHIRTEIFNQEIKVNHLRMSMFLSRGDGLWQAEHIHISLPTEIHGEEEAYPVKELEERNLVLQRLVEQRTKKLNDVLDELALIASTDPVTRIFNRKKIDDSLAVELRRAGRYDRLLAVILLDIDHFKQVNDAHGHLVGDQVLYELAVLVAGRVRKTDIFGRYGGEEFLIICPEIGLEQAAGLAESIRARVSEYGFSDGVPLTVSLGVAQFTPGETREALIARADAAMYAAKRLGRNRVAAA